MALSKLFNRNNSYSKLEHVDLCPEDSFYQMNFYSITQTESASYQLKYIDSNDYQHTFLLKNNRLYLMNSYHVCQTRLFHAKKMGIQGRIKKIIFNCIKESYVAILFWSSVRNRSFVKIYTNFKNDLNDITMDFEDGDIFEKWKSINLNPESNSSNGIKMKQIQMAAKYEYFIHLRSFGRNVTCMATCPKTGNFAMVVENKILIYQLRVLNFNAYHNMAQLKLCDFVLIRIIKQFTLPIEINLVYNYLATLSYSDFSIFHGKFNDHNVRLPTVDLKTALNSYFNNLHDENERLVHHHDFLMAEEVIEDDNNEKNEKFAKIQLVPFVKNSNSNIYYLALYVWWHQEICCYLIDVRQDPYNLVRISRLLIPPEIGIKDFGVSLDHDLIHVLCKRSLNTFATNIHTYLINRKEIMEIPEFHDFERMYLITTNPLPLELKFVKIISTQSIVTLITENGYYSELLKPMKCQVEYKLILLSNSFGRLSTIVRRWFYRRAYQPAFQGVASKTIEQDDPNDLKQWKPSRKWKSFFDPDIDWKYLSFAKMFTSDQLPLTQRKWQIYNYEAAWIKFHDHFEV